MAQVKIKTNRGACKRFKATKGGLKYRRALRNHILTKKAKKLKRKIRQNQLIKKCDVKSVCRMLNIQLQNQ